MFSKTYENLVLAQRELQTDVICHKALWAKSFVTFLIAIDTPTFALCPTHSRIVAVTNNQVIPLVKAQFNHLWHQTACYSLPARSTLIMFKIKHGNAAPKVQQRVAVTAPCCSSQ